MPNYITTKIRAAQHVLDHLVKDGEIDFNTVVPTPDHIYQGDIGCDRMDDENTWYVWNRKNWGTKWNAIGAKDAIRPGELHFDTAWGYPKPVIEALSRHFPDETIQVAYATEDTGSDQAVYAFKNGHIVQAYIPAEQSDEAINLGTLIRYGQAQRQYYDEIYDGYESERPGPGLDDRYDPFTRLAL